MGWEPWDDPGGWVRGSAAIAEIRRTKTLYHKGHEGSRRKNRLNLAPIEAKTSEVYAKLGSVGMPWDDPRGEGARSAARTP